MVGFFGGECLGLLFEGAGRKFRLHHVERRNNSLLHLRFEKVGHRFVESDKLIRHRDLLADHEQFDESEIHLASELASPFRDLRLGENHLVTAQMTFLLETRRQRKGLGECNFKVPLVFVVPDLVRARADFQFRIVEPSGPAQSGLGSIDFVTVRSNGSGGAWPGASFNRFIKRILLRISLNIAR